VADHLVLWHRWLPPRDAGGLLEHAEVAEWRRTVAARFQVGGGRVLSELGATVVGSFDPSEAVDALDLALDLIDEAAAHGFEVAIGAALGPTTHPGDDGTPVGTVLERAQHLANRARRAELVLDARVRDEVKEVFLFGSQVAGHWRGTTVDRDNPRRVETADAITELARPGFPPVGADVVADLGTHLDEGTARTFVLRGPVGAGARELVEAVAEAREHARLIGLGASPGGVVPLASLRFALLREYGSPEAVIREASKLEGGAETGQALGRVAGGGLVPLDVLAPAVGAWLAGDDDAGRAWVVLNPLNLVDGATLAALLAARARTDFVLFARLPMDAVLPSPLAALDETVVEHVVPPLKTSDARFVAEQVMGHDTDDDVARRVAVLGGDTVLGVVEAARTLIASGELVQGEGDGFVWRAGPRSGASAISTEDLLEERIELLDDESRRVLEALCVVPDGCDRELLERVAARDGIGPATFERCLERLAHEALARGDARPRPASSLLRWRVLERTPAARSMEVHRFVGQSLADTATNHPPLIIELGFYLMEGGLDEDGRPLVTSMVEPLLGAGYRRAAKLLSGWLTEAVEDSAEGDAPRTPVPPPAIARDEAPPSSELALEEVLEETAVPDAPEADEPEFLELDEADIVEVTSEPPTMPRDSELVLELDEELDARPAEQTHDLVAPPIPAELAEPRTAEIANVDAIERAAASDAPDSVQEDLDALEADDDEEIPASFSRDLDTLTPAPLDEGSTLDEHDEDSDATMLSDAAELMTLFRAHQVPHKAKRERAKDQPTVELDTRSGATDVGPAPVRSFAIEAAARIREGDYEGLELAMQRAIAEGGDLGAIGRIRAIAQLARGEVAMARRSLDQALERGRDDRAARARYELAMAWLELKSGEAMEGVRRSLSALACSRELTDARGEAAALKTLAACYRALGRDEEADRFERA